MYEDSFGAKILRDDCPLYVFPSFMVQDAISKDGKIGLFLPYKSIILSRIQN